MAATDQAGHGPEPTRRDFLYIATGALGAVGVAGLAWPFIDQMNPDAGSQALASIEVDIGNVAVGESMTVMWRGKPIFIRQRTEEEVAAAKDVDVADLIDPDSRNANLPTGTPATDENRAAEGREAWLVQIGICTHLGCVPLGQQGSYNGWFCPCHGSVYDTSGRVRLGPAPENMHVPPFRFATDTNLVIG